MIVAIEAVCKLMSMGWAYMVHHGFEADDIYFKSRPVDHLLILRIELKNLAFDKQLAATFTIILGTLALIMWEFTSNLWIHYALIPCFVMSIGFWLWSTRQYRKCQQEEIIYAVMTS